MDHHQRSYEIRIESVFYMTAVEKFNLRHSIWKTKYFPTQTLPTPTHIERDRAEGSFLYLKLVHSIFFSRRAFVRVFLLSKYVTIDLGLFYLKFQSRGRSYLRKCR